MTQGRRQLFKDKEHLVRMAAIFAVGVTLFLVLQLALVPETFGLYGHYRGAALGEEAAKPLIHAGRAQCARCHLPQVEAKKAGKHATLGCEGCHGALMSHAANPRGSKPAAIDTRTLCPVCHEHSTARPKWVKQIDSVEHSSGEPCNSCHQPHAPEM